MGYHAIQIGSWLKMKGRYNGCLGQEVKRGARVLINPKYFRQKEREMIKDIESFRASATVFLFELSSYY